MQPWEQEVQVSADQRTEVAHRADAAAGLGWRSPAAWPGSEVWVGNDKTRRDHRRRPARARQPEARQLPREGAQARLCSPGSGRCR